MLHKCKECGSPYLVSQYISICDLCGSYLQRRIESLYESDGATEWWKLAAEAMQGAQVERGARWRIT